MKIGLPPLLLFIGEGSCHSRVGMMECDLAFFKENAYRYAATGSFHMVEAGGRAALCARGDIDEALGEVGVAGGERRIDFVRRDYGVEFPAERARQYARDSR